MKCKTCGANLKDNVCEYCGYEAYDLSCPKCSEQLDESWTMCPECGHAIDENFKKKNKWIVMLLCITVVFLGVHKFYEDNYKMGVIYLDTAGFLFVGVQFI